MKQFIKKECPTCGKEFVPKFDQRQKYCDSYKGGAKTCKGYGSKIRNGKMDALAIDNTINSPPVSPSILMTDIEEKIKPLKDKINSLQSEILEIRKEYNHIKNNMYGDEELDNSAALRHNEKGTEQFKKLLSQEGLSNSEIERYKKSFQKCTDFVEKLKNQYQVNLKKKNEIRPLFIDKNIRLFRLIEEVNNYAYSLLPSDGVLTANKNKLLMQFKTYYPFDKVVLEEDFKAFLCLGTLPQPFFGCLTGERNSGTTRTSIKICKDLVNFFGFKTLYIGNIEQINNEFSELIYAEINSSLFAYKACNSKLEITKLLVNSPYELLIIDPICYFHIDYNFIYQLQKQHSKLSIIGILKSNLESLKRNAHVIIDVKNGMGVAVKGGNNNYNVSAWENANYSDEYESEYEEY